MAKREVTNTACLNCGACCAVPALPDSRSFFLSIQLSKMDIQRLPVEALRHMRVFDDDERMNECTKEIKNSDLLLNLCQTVTNLAHLADVFSFEARLGLTEDAQFTNKDQNMGARKTKLLPGVAETTRLARGGD